MSPVDGVVLKRVRESESVVPAGDPLVEIGDPGKLEIVVDLLSTDAVRVAAGARAIIDEWGGDRRSMREFGASSPAGFTKVSALGVEEQRVNVVLDFVDLGRRTCGARRRLPCGSTRRAWEAADVLRVPTGALFREGAQWAVYVIDEDRARRTFVQLGHQTGQYAEVVSGISPNARVVLHPGDTMTDGARVRVRAPTAFRQESLFNAKPAIVVEQREVGDHAQRLRVLPHAAEAASVDLISSPSSRRDV